MITYEPYLSDWIVRKDSNSIVQKFVEVYKPYPIIGEKYMVVHFGDYDNSEYGENFPIEITAENIHEISFRMNDPDNDITEYILIEQ